MNDERDRDEVAELRRAEVHALSAIKGSPTMEVILRRLDIMTRGSKNVPLNETNWSEKRAHADGYVSGLDDFRLWLTSCSESVIDHETGGVVSARNQSLSERKRRNEK